MLRDPWSGALVDGKIYGRGSADMKCGTTASIFTYAYLHRIREQLKGRLSLVVVSDEETFGPWGARYLAEHRPDVFGDCLPQWRTERHEHAPLRREGARSGSNFTFANAEHTAPIPT